MAATINTRLRFLLNDQVIELDSFSANRTVLQYLREDRRATGTKEGCAEGDCGACTVAVGELVNGKIAYKAVNACIQLLGTLHGRHLITVEHLASDQDGLHPVQRHMVAQHGAQCGFCTPGFVMSMFVHHSQQGATDRATIDDMLAGNLCRCTGYGPIITATQQAAADPIPATWHQRMADAAKVLQEWQADAAGLDNDVADDRFYAPTKLDDLADLAQQNPDGTLLAGATDVGLWITKQRRHLNPIIYLGNVSDLQEIKVARDHLYIGAGVAYEQALATIKDYLPSMTDLICRIGSRQIRNVGTLGGNIANGSPIGDMPPPLIALGATLHLRLGGGTRDLPLEAFFIDYGKQDRRPGEIVTGISIPLKNQSRLKTYKISKRFDQDITAVLGAFMLTVTEGQITDARLCYGGMAGIPKRATNTEAALIGQAWSKATFIAAGNALDTDFQPLTDMRASATYRLRVAKNVLLKYFEECELGENRRLDRRQMLGALS